MAWKPVIEYWVIRGDRVVTKCRTKDAAELHIIGVDGAEVVEVKLLGATIGRKR